MKNTVVVLLLLALLTGTLTGCEKYTLDKDVAYTFSNGFNESVTLNIYQNKADYNNAANPWKQLTLPAHGQQTLTMEIGKKYYIDWYNANGKYSNWVPNTTGTSQIFATPAPELNVAAAPQTITLSQNAPNYDRYLLLPGNSSSSTWQVIGEYLGGSQLGPAPYAQLTFNKDFTGSIRYLVATNDTGMMTCQFYNYDNFSQNEYLSVSMYSAINGQTLAMCTYQPASPYPATSRDTLACNLYFLNSSSTYVLVRQ